jgi:phage terminase Nu1 subunit (DNA packaging protein)
MPDDSGAQMTLEKQAAFAKRMTAHMGREVARSTVSRWADAGRIVMDGKLVNVEASLAQLNGTQGARQDVSDRHAQEAVEKTTAPIVGGQGVQPTADLSMDKARRVRAVAEARIKHAQAEITEAERDEVVGRLIQKEVVDFVLNDYSATLRSLLETFADRIAPVIYPLQTLEETHAALDEAAESILVEMAETMKRRERQHKET